MDHLWLSWGLQSWEHSCTCGHAQCTHTHTHSKLPAALLKGAEIKWSPGSWGISWLSLLAPAGYSGAASWWWLTQLGLPNLRSSNLCKAVFLPRWPSGQESVCQWRKCRFNSLGQEEPPLQNSAWKLMVEESGGSMGQQELDTTEHACACIHTHTYFFT